MAAVFSTWASAHCSNFGERRSRCSSSTIAFHLPVHKIKRTILSDCQYLPQYFRFAHFKRCQPFFFPVLSHAWIRMINSPSTPFTFDWKCLNMCECVHERRKVATSRIMHYKHLSYYCVRWCSWLLLWHLLPDCCERCKFHSEVQFKWWNLLKKICGCCSFNIMCVLHFDDANERNISVCAHTVMMRVQVRFFEQHTLIFELQYPVNLHTHIHSETHTFTPTTIIITVATYQ